MTNSRVSPRHPNLNVDTFFAERRTNPAYDRSYQRAWRGLDPELSAWRHPIRRYRQRPR